ncbi:MAG: XdhC family protein [Luminiphilus sp.]|nr:XdhC family protein [Luminiphilus sp.]MBL6820645.1 XdhC family protein [Luminiphilus sp.]
MNSTDQTILSCLLASLTEGEQPWLVTVVATIGSSPRPVGSLVAFRADGSQVGSVSGGCVEEDLIARLLAGEFNGPQIYLTDYGVSAEDNEKWGLPCGGRLELAIQQLDTKDLDWVKDAHHAMSTRRTLSRSVSLQSGETQISPAEQFAPLEKTGDTLIHCFGPRHRLLLVGAGQLAANLSTLALAMDYEVLLADSREWALDQWQGPDVEKILGLPDDVVREHAADEHCAVITLSHDPRVDDMALMEALDSACWYVGALGSVRTTEKRIQRLSQLGLSNDALARLHAPVGLSIGSKTTMEIAVSIMAQLTQLRRESKDLAHSAQPAELGAR